MRFARFPGRSVSGPLVQPTSRPGCCHLNLSAGLELRSSAPAWHACLRLRNAAKGSARTGNPSVRDRRASTHCADDVAATDGRDAQAHRHRPISPLCPHPGCPEAASAVQPNLRVPKPNANCSTPSFSHWRHTLRRVPLSDSRSASPRPFPHPESVHRVATMALIPSRTLLRRRVRCAHRHCNRCAPVPPLGLRGWTGGESDAQPTPPRRLHTRMGGAVTTRSSRSAGRTATTTR